jgi:acyl-CoA thioesterase
MHFDELIKKTQDKTKTNNLIIPQDWSQGRAAFGGLLAAMIYTAMRCKVRNEGFLRFISTSFVNPIVMDESFSIEVSFLSKGRTVTQMEGRAIQKDKTAAIVLAGFGIERESSIIINDAKSPILPPPEKGIILPYLPDITPDFTKNFDYRWGIGNIPFTGSKNSDVGGWMRFSEAPAQFTDAHLIALIDIWPVGTLSMLKKHAPASTLSWNIELIHLYSALPDEWLLYKSTVKHAKDGYANAKASIWNRAGKLIAISSQIVIVYD